MPVMNVHCKRLYSSSLGQLMQATGCIHYRGGCYLQPLHTRIPGGKWHSWLASFRLSCFSHVRLCATPWTVAHQAPLSLGVSRQEYWSWPPCPAPGDIPDPGIEPTSFTSPALAGGFFTTGATKEAYSWLSWLQTVASLLGISASKLTSLIFS